MKSIFLFIIISIMASSCRHKSDVIDIEKRLRKMPLPTMTELNYPYPTILNSSPIDQKKKASLNRIYGLKKPKNFLDWYDQTPEDFQFSVKASKYITHVRRLVVVETIVANFFASGVLGLREKLGGILWQLSPNLMFSMKNISEFFKILPRDHRQALIPAAQHDEKVAGLSWIENQYNGPLYHFVEARGQSFDCEPFIDLAREYGVILVTVDSDGKWPYFAPMGGHFYYRMHGLASAFDKGYADEVLDRFPSELRDFSEKVLSGFVFFDNDAVAYAPRDALSLLNALKAG